MTEKDLSVLVMLTLIFPKGSPSLQQLLEKHNSPENAFNEIIHASRDKGIANTVNKAEKLLSDSPGIADDIVVYCRNNDITIVTIFDEEYPIKLKNISTPPVLLYCKGDVNVLKSKHTVAMIGARKATKYSAEVAKYFSASLSQRGITVVSGFAKGIDSISHEAAITSGGKTIVVLACGTDYDYPSGSEIFKKQICENGVVISEYPPLDKPDRASFKVRNRIISGLSDGVLVVQAGEKSGSLNTVSHALEQGRDVYVIPPSDILGSTYAGQTEILREGAVPVYSPDDIVRELLNLK